MRYAMIAVVAMLAAVLFMVVARSSSVAVAGVSGVPTTINQNKDPKMKIATFAAGCFWGVEETFRHVPGVVSTRVGYTGGTTEDPDYQQVCTDTTGHAEAVEVTYDPAKISYAELLDAFWTCHNPTTVDRQGPDEGTQYRSAIFTHSAQQEKIAKESLKEVADGHFFKHKIVTEIVPAKTFYPAETYHQQYMAKHGGVCHTGIAKVTTKLAQEAKQARETMAPATQP